VSPLYFFLKNLATFFAHRYHYITIHFYCFTRVSPQGATPRLFYLSDLVSTLFFVNLPTKFFPSGVTPLEGVTRGGPPPAAPSDATEDIKAVCSSVKRIDPFTSPLCQKHCLTINLWLKKITPGEKSHWCYTASERMTS